MKLKNNTTIDDLLRERLDDFVKILTFAEVTSVQRLFGGRYGDYVYAKTEFEKFHREYDQATRNKTVGGVYRGIALYNQTGLDWETIRRIFGNEPNSNRHMSTKLYLPLIEKFGDRKHGAYFVKKERHSFAKHYSIGLGRLSEIFGDKDLLKKVLDAKSDYYTKRQRRLIFNIMEKTRLDALVERIMTEMTKSEKEQYQEEWERGEHMLSLEQYMKEEAKQKRRQKGRDETLVRKIARELLAGTIEELDKLKTENADLKKQLKQLLEKNDDVPAAEPEPERVQTATERTQNPPKPVFDNSDVPSDVFHAARISLVLGERGVQLVKALDDMAEKRCISAKTANELADGLGLDKTYFIKEVVPATSEKEQEARRKLISACRKTINQLKNGELANG